MNEKIKKVYDTMQTLASAFNQVIKGKEEFIEQFLIAFFAGGHVLIEDVPGIGKTTAVKTLSKLVKGMECGRIQCTPDLLPYDITGVDVYEGTSGKFHFEKGPIFTDLFLADEINRATPKTQSAMLEAMAERQVTVGTTSYKLSNLFFVAATQNPVESEGAYPLPNAELDRFLMKLTPGYPDFENECAIVKEDPSLNILPNLHSVVLRSDVEEATTIIQQIFVDDKIIAFAVEIARQSRTCSSVEVGVSPRGVLWLIKACKSRAVFKGRDFVNDDDVKSLIKIVFAHRIIFSDKKANINLLLDEWVESAKIHSKL